MADDKLKAAFMADLGVANRERLLAAPDTRDHSLRGRLRSNGTGNAPAQQSNGFDDASVSGWAAFANFHKENVRDGDLADLHGGQLHRLNREAVGGSNTRPTPTSFPRPSLPHYNQPQDHTPSSFYDRPNPRIQPPTRVQPMTNGNGVRGDSQNALELARSMQFKGSYSSKSGGGSRRGSPPRGSRGGCGGSDFRDRRGGFEPHAARAGYARGGPDFRGGRGGHEVRGPRDGSFGHGGSGYNSPSLEYGGYGAYAHGAGLGNTHPSVFGPRGGSGGRATRGFSPRRRGEFAIRGAASGRPQPSSTARDNSRPVVPDDVWSCAEDDTEPVYDSDDNSLPTQHPLPVTKRPQKLASSKEFMSAIMDSKWAPKKH
ncbi:hypothetical protein IWX49DRAFT_588400 [Phyllosticta citricarpa]|uniref:Uncharacterized protein n=1 Tax=Phyllosticta paracitricarpa TaxID=2016321 RepID=A0ABR1NEU0_9PEZI